MQDERGLYYFPQVGDVKAKMYVRRADDGDIEFRMWQADHPEVWDKHQWLPMNVIRRAAEMYAQGKGPHADDPVRLYDIQVAKALLAEAAK